MSCQTAPLELVATAMTARPDRQRTLARRLEQALGRQARLELLEAQGQVAEAGRLDGTHVQLVHALLLEHVDPAPDDDPQAGPGLERRADPIVAEPHARELAALVLQREVGVPGGRHRDPADLALDPQVAQPVVGPDCVADGVAQLGHAQDRRSDPAGGRLGRRQDGGSGRPGRSQGRHLGCHPVVGQGVPGGRAQSGGSEPLMAGLRPGSGTRRSGCRPGSCRPR